MESEVKTKVMAKAGFSGVARYCVEGAAKMGYPR